jgi:hypothetical protein
MGYNDNAYRKLGGQLGYRFQYCPNFGILEIICVAKIGSDRVNDH